MWISNPLASNLFMPLASTLSAMLSWGLFAVLAGRGLSKDMNLRKQVLLRWYSWLGLSGLILMATLSGILPFVAFIALVSFAGSWEFGRLFKLNANQILLQSIFAIALPFISLFGLGALCAAVFLSALVSFTFSIAKYESLERLAPAMLAVFYSGFLSSHAVLLFQYSSSGPSMVLLAICATALADIFAFVFGKLFKGAKLAEKLSPNKTYSGAVGSFVGAALGAAVLNSAVSLNLPLVHLVSVALVVACSSILGDLFESALKRHAGVKDAGGLLPGFGGVLDRVDGLLFVFPAVYYLNLLVFGG